MRLTNGARCRAPLIFVDKNQPNYLWQNIFYLRKNIIRKGHSGKSILKFWRKTTFNLKKNMSLNSLMTLMVGIKYCGALHLWCYITNVWLQISGGSAAFKYPDVFCKYLTAPMIKGFFYK